MGTTPAQHRPAQHRPAPSRHPVPTVRLPDLPSVPSFRPDVQGLRAVAVLLVVAGHVLGAPVGGYVGVDVFFVISGFLITGLLLREHARTGRISLREFYARRVRRLLPAAVLVLAVTNVVAYLVFAGERAGQALRDALWSLGFLANVHFSAIGTDYFDQARPPSPVQHYWSLAVEEQYYLVWPWVLLALLAAVRGRRRTLLLLVGGLSAASLAWSVLQTASDPTAAYFSTPARAWELGAGALLAVALHARLLPRVLPWAGAVLVWLGLAGITAAALLYDERTPFPGSAALLPVFSTVLVLLGGTAAHRNPVLVNPVAGYLGRVSYSLYLWHWPVLVVATALLPAGEALVATTLVVSLVLASLCHHLVEEPVRLSGWLSRRPPPTRPARARAHAQRRSARTAVALSATASLLVGGWVLPALALTTTAPPPVAAPSTGEPLAVLRAAVAASVAPERWPALEVPLETISTSGAPEWITDRCDNVNAGNVDRCTYGSPLAPRRLAVLGDSMATSWLPALREAFPAQAWRIHVLTRNQCPNPMVTFFRNTPSVPFVECDLHKQFVVDQLARVKPDLVLMSNAITLLGNQVGAPDDRVQGWSDGLARFLTQVQRHADQVVVLAPPPRAGNLQSCVTRVSSPADCTLGISDDWRDLRTAEQGAAVRAGATFVDPEAWFCAAGACPAVVGGTPVYTDGRHLTAAYARRLAPQLGPALEQALATTPT